MTRARAGFTLLEMVLASVIASMVVLVAGGLCAALAVADRASSTTLERTTEFSMTQGAIRRAFLRLVVAEDREVGEDEQLPRPRLLLEPDAAALGAPRFEVVVSRPPVSAALATTAAEWAFAAEDEGSLNFVSSDGSGGQERGVFELRPDGARERVMTALGLDRPWWDLPEQDERLARAGGARAAIRPASLTDAGVPDPDAPGWTLWYRRMIPEEVAALDRGAPPVSDGENDPELEARRLAGAVRLATGLTEAQWRVYKSDEWVTDYRALMTRDLPAFVQFRARARNGTYAEWLFEIGWIEAENVGTDEQAAAFGGAGAGDPADPGAGEDPGAEPGETDPTIPPPTPSGSQGGQGGSGGGLPQGDGDSASGGTSIRLQRDR